MSLLSEMTLSPAYGRDYKTASEVRAAFHKGVDFRAHHFSGHSTYCSIRDFEREGVSEAVIRFDKLRRQIIVKATF